MKKFGCISHQFWKKLSYLLKWNPTTVMFSFSGKQLLIFSKYHDHIVGENLQYLYMIISLFTITVSASYVLIALLETWMFNTTFFSVANLYVIPLTGVCFIYHTAFFIMLRINCFKKKLQKIPGILNFFSLVILCLLLFMFTGYFSLRDPLVIFINGAETSIFGLSMITFYYQSYFLVTMVLWVLSIMFILIGPLLVENDAFDNAVNKMCTIDCY